MATSLSLKPVEKQQTQLVVRFYSNQCHVKSAVVVSARRIGSAMNRFYTKQTKILGPKNFRISFFLKVPKKLFVAQISFFLKVPKKLFVAQEINLEESLIFRGEYSVFPNT